MSMADFSSVTETGEKPFPCVMCHKIFKRKKHLNKHSHTHRSDNLYECNQCGKQFKVFQDLWVHEIMVHVEPKMKPDCDQCGAVLHTKQGERCMCVTNIKSPSYPNSLEIKKITKTSSEDPQPGNHIHNEVIYPFTCDYQKCSYKCRTECLLRNHKRSKHTGEKPFTSIDCGKSFDSQTNRKVHMRKPTRIYPYKCDQGSCNYKCSWKPQSENHKRSKHSCERPYNCIDCGRGFSSTCALKIHTIVHHAGNYPYSCDTCNRKFLFKTRFQRHQRNHNRARSRKNKKSANKYGSKSSDQLNINSVVESTDIHNSGSQKMQLNSLHKNPKRANLGKQNVLSVTGLIHQQINNFQKPPEIQSPPCKDSSPGFVKEPEQQKFQSVVDAVDLNNVHQAKPPTYFSLCSSERNKDLGRERDQNSKSTTEPTYSRNIHHQVNETNSKCATVKSSETLVKQIYVQSTLSVADLIHVYDIKLKKSGTSQPCLRTERNPRIVNHHELQGSPLEDTDLKASSPYCPLVNAENSLKLETKIDQQPIQSVSESTDLVNINTNLLKTNAEDNTGVAKLIIHQKAPSVAELIRLYDLNLAANTNPASPHTEISQSIEKQMGQQYVQSSADLNKLDNSPLYNAERSPGFAEYGDAQTDESIIEVLDLDDNLPSVPMYELDNMSLQLPRRIPKDASSESDAALLNPTDCQNAQVLVRQVELSDNNSEIKPVTPDAIVASERYMNATTSLVYTRTNCSQIQTSTTEESISAKNCINSSTQINNKTQEVMKKRVHHTQYTQTTATRQAFPSGSDAYLLQCANLKIAQIVLERVDSNGPCKQVERIRYTKSVNEQLSSNDKCNKKPTFRYKKRKIVRSCTKKNQFFCDECGKKFSSSNKLKTHKRIHTGERPYKCGECGASFTTAQTKKRHTFTHTGKYPFVCDQPKCSYMSSRKDNLETHKRKKHNGHRPFIVESVVASASQISLNIHKLTHTGNYTWLCKEPNCFYKCVSRIQLGNHIRSKHTGEKPYVCGKCGKGYASTSALNCHHLHHHT